MAVFLLRRVTLVALGCAGFALAGCDSFKNALGADKNPPDEFTVVTKAPLVIPPDYNLRPPQPGIASRNEPDPDDQARSALFPQDAPMLGTGYSDGEKLLLTKTSALTVDPNIRKEITSDAGQDDQGPALTQKVLYQSGGSAPAANAPAAAPVKPAPAPAQGPLPGTGEPPAPPPAKPAQ